MLCGSSMACAPLAAPGVGGFAAGGVLLPAFCPSWTRSFVALSRQQRQAGGRELRTASSTSPLITPSSVLRAKRRCVSALVLRNTEVGEGRRPCTNVQVEHMPRKTTRYVYHTQKTRHFYFNIRFLKSSRSPSRCLHARTSTAAAPPPLIPPMYILLY